MRCPEPLNQSEAWYSTIHMKTYIRMTHGLANALLVYIWPSSFNYNTILCLLKCSNEFNPHCFYLRWFKVTSKFEIKMILILTLHFLMIAPLSMLLSMNSGRCIRWIRMQPETCPVPGSVSLPAHPRLVLVTKRILRLCSLSGWPINLRASLILKPNTSPHLYLDFIEVFALVSKQ